jgi:hypothetical protein
MQVNYSYTRNYDDNSVTLGSTYQAASAPQPFDDSLEWGPSAFDMRHFFTFNYVWDLPFGPGRRFGRGLRGPFGKLVEGWQLNGILTLNSGSPFSAVLGFDRAGLLPRSGGGGQRPDLAPGADPDAILGGPDRYFDSAGFLVPPAGYLGNLGRNTLTGPGVRTLDLGLTKQTALTGTQKIEFRAEFFNILKPCQFRAAKCDGVQRERARAERREDQQNHDDGASDSVRAQVHFLGAAAICAVSRDRCAGRSDVIVCSDTVDTVFSNAYTRARSKGTKPTHGSPSRVEGH